MRKVLFSFLHAIGLTHAASTSRTIKPSSSTHPKMSYHFTENQAFLSDTNHLNGTSREAEVAMPQLLQILSDGSFFEKVGDEWKLDFRKDILPIIKEDFKYELPRLKRARADRRGIPEQRPDSFGVLLYGKEDGEEKAMTYYELDRTLTAVQSLRWIKDGKRENFNEKLSQESWEWIIARFNEEDARIFEKEHAEECFALITSVIINDLGKDPELAKDYQKHVRSQKRGGQPIVTEEAEGNNISSQNHDMILSLSIRANMIPCLSTLRPDLLHDILLGIHVSAECNLGQLAQAENLPASLYPLLRFRQNRRAWHFRFMEQVVDLAGARGHFDNTHALVFNEFVARGNRAAHTVAESVIWGGVDVVDGYNSVLLERYSLLQSKGYQTQLSIDQPSHRALMRLFCLSGTSDSTIAQFLEQTLLHSELAAPFREHLISSLTRTGLEYITEFENIPSEDQTTNHNEQYTPAIQITYSPSMLSGALSHPWPSQSSKQIAISAILQYMSKCYTFTPSEQINIPKWHNDKVTVLERDVFSVVDAYVKTDRFFEKPEGLIEFNEGRVPVFSVANKLEDEDGEL